MIKTRKVKRADLKAVLEMVRALAAFHDDEAALTFDQLERDTMGAHPWVPLIVAEADGALIGYAGMIPLTKFADGVRAMDVHHLFVQPDWRRRGIGRKLLLGCAEHAKDAGCSNLTIGTSPDNTVAQEAYISMGFEKMRAGGPRFKLSLDSLRLLVAPDT